MASLLPKWKRLAEQKDSMNFDVQIAHSVTELGENAWDALSGGRPLSSFRWYRFGETVWAEFPPTYLILSAGGAPVARAAFWLKRQEWWPITSRLVRSGAERFLNRWPLFSCETPLVSLPGLILPEGSTRSEALETIALSAQELGKREHASFALFSYIDRQEAHLEGWPKAYTSIFYPDEETRLDISWPDFDSYLAHMAKSTRRNYRLHGKKAEELGVEVTVHPNVLEMDRALALIYNVDTFHGVGHRPWTRAVLEHSDLVDSTWIAAHVGDRLVGCCSVIGDGGVLAATLLGLDYSLPEYIYVYYQIMYAAVRCAIESRARVLYGGGGAYELKRRLGLTKLPDDYMLVAASAPWLQWPLRGAAHWIGSQQADVEVLENSEDQD
jgi:predicted N-acyltransferase